MAATQIENKADGYTIGTASTQKVGFFGATPVDQPGATEKLNEALSTLGLRATGAAAPLDSGTITLAEAANIVVGTTTGTKIGTATSQKLGFYNATPVVQPASADQTALTDNTGGSVADATLADGFTQGAALTDNTTGAASTTLAAGVGTYMLTFPIELAGITSALDVVTDLTLGHKFKVLSMKWVTTTVASTGAKNVTLTADIGATPITSLSIVLDSDTASTTTLGGVTEVDATAANTGTASDTISIVAGTVAAFAEGSGCVMLEIQNMDTADAFASLAAERDLARADATTQNDNDAKIAELLNALRTALVDTGVMKGAA